MTNSQASGQVFRISWLAAVGSIENALSFDEAQREFSVEIGLLHLIELPKDFV